MSIWNKDVLKVDSKKLDKDIEVDTLIIGGGMTGILTAYYLRDNKSICLVERNNIGYGITLNSNAKINYFQGTILTDIESVSNRNNAIKYLEMQRDGIEELINIIKSNKIDCNLERVPSYVFASKEEDISKLDKEVKLLKDNGILIKEGNLPIDINSYKSYYVEDTYIFNPLKFLTSIYNLIKDKVSIYQDSKITKIEKKNKYYICYGNNFKIKANNVVIACHYPFNLTKLLLPLKSYIEKSYIIVSKVNKDKKFTAISVGNPMYSIRYYNDTNNIYQISLSSSHNTSIKQNDLKNFNDVINNFKINSNDIIDKYSNMDIMTSDNMPYIGKLDNNLYIGTGYNTWGMTNSTMAGKIISNLILNKKNNYNKAFSPTRINKANLIKGPLIISSNIKSLIGTKLNKNKKWYSNNIKFKNIKGKSIAIYIDKNNKKHIIYNRCPHLGCSLIFNEVELTWDCPCHSSRFNIDGKCIEGPSNYDVSYKK